MAEQESSFKWVIPLKVVSTRIAFFLDSKTRIPTAESYGIAAEVQNPPLTKWLVREREREREREWRWRKEEKGRDGVRPQRKRENGKTEMCVGRELRETKWTQKNTVKGREREREREREKHAPGHHVKDFSLSENTPGVFTLLTSVIMINTHRALMCISIMISHFCIDSAESWPAEHIWPFHRHLLIPKHCACCSLPISLKRKLFPVNLGEKALSVEVSLANCTSCLSMSFLCQACVHVPQIQVALWWQLPLVLIWPLLQSRPPFRTLAIPTLWSCNGRRSWLHGGHIHCKV